MPQCTFEVACTLLQPRPASDHLSEEHRTLRRSREYDTADAPVVVSLNKHPTVTDDSYFFVTMRLEFRGPFLVVAPNRFRGNTCFSKRFGKFLSMGDTCTEDDGLTSLAAIEPRFNDSVVTFGSVDCVGQLVGSKISSAFFHSAEVGIRPHSEASYVNEPAIRYGIPNGIDEDDFLVDLGERLAVRPLRSCRIAHK